mgnify:CR=1 FL=1
MKYICKICGYVYDESKQTIPFLELQDSWVCPLCGAAKSEFEPQSPPESKQTIPRKTVKIDADMRNLSLGELSAVCSNLARGCEKQYKEEESQLFAQLAEYFAQIRPAEETPQFLQLLELLSGDLKTGYPDIDSIASVKEDRGALRVCVWGEKVTRILNTLLQKYEAEGESFLADTEVWICTVCGFVFVGDNPPELCPVCKVPSWKFEKIEGGND